MTTHEPLPVAMVPMLAIFAVGLVLVLIVLAPVGWLAYRRRKPPVQRARLVLTDYEPDYRERRLASFQRPAAKGFNRQHEPKDAA